MQRCLTDSYRWVGPNRVELQILWNLVFGDNVDVCKPQLGRIVSSQFHAALVHIERPDFSFGAEGRDSE